MDRRNIAVIGSGISGLSAAWLLSSRHRVVLFETDSRVGGHANTVTVNESGRSYGVDTGFIVFNPPAYPNFTALLDHLGVATAPSDMGFSVSLRGGRCEYAGSNLLQLIGHAANLADPGHWRMIRDIPRFFSVARDCLSGLDDEMTLGRFLDEKGFSAEFLDRHLLPMAGAIWSAAPGDMRQYPARSFIRFFENHGLLNLTNRPQWKTVRGGSRTYVDALLAAGRVETLAGTGVSAVRRFPQHVAVTTASGVTHLFDDVVIAAHADDALAMLGDPTADERDILSAFRYSRNRAVLHRDPRLMPLRRRLWSSWNYMDPVAGSHARTASVTYWMNKLQPLPTRQNLFVSLNPATAPVDGSVLAEFDYAHPIFDPAAMAAQRRLWSLQGKRRTWFCGAYFGAGFHEDGLQAGLAVAEELGSCRRPWTVPGESDRMCLTSRADEPQWMDAAE